jgi:hypothetical protein
MGCMWNSVCRMRITGFTVKHRKTDVNFFWYPTVRPWTKRSWTMWSRIKHPIDKVPMDDPLDEANLWHNVPFGPNFFSNLTKCPRLSGCFFHFKICYEKGKINTFFKSLVQFKIYDKIMVEAHFAIQHCFYTLVTRSLRRTLPFLLSHLSSLDTSIIQKNHMVKFNFINLKVRDVLSQRNLSKFK